jgi:hypothetical protein
MGKEGAPGDDDNMGVLIGLGMVAATALTHRRFAGRGLKVWALEAGGDVLSCATIGLVLSLFSSGRTSS